MGKRRLAASAAILLAFSAIAVPAASARPATAGARSGVPPFCVLRHGPRGFDLPQICRYYDYQECLEAAIGWNGNCVLNIDYHGKIARPPGATWTPPDWR